MDNQLAKIIRCGIIIILIAVPLIYSSYMQNSFGTPKKAFFEISMAVLLTLFAIQIVVSPERFISQKTPVDLLVLAWLVWNALGCLFSIDRMESMREFVYLSCLVGFFFIVTRNMRSRGQALFMMGAIIGLGILESVYGIAELFGAKLLFESNIKGSIPVGESALWRWSILGTFGNANHLASYLALTCPLLLGYGRLWKGEWRYILLLCLVVAFACLVLTGARGSMLAGIVGLSIPIIWSYHKGIRFDARHALAAVAMLVALLAVVFMIKPNIGRDIVIRIKSSSPFGKGGSIQFRLLTWGVSMRMIEHRPIFGSGPGTYKLLYLPTLAEYLKGGDPLSVWGFMQKMNEPHNEFIQSAVETGIPGLALLLTFLIGAIRAGFRALSKLKPPDDFFVITAIACIIGVLVDAAASISFHVVPTCIAFWATAAFLSSSPRGVPPASRRPSRPLPRPPWRWAVAAYLVVFSYIAFCNALNEMAFERAFKEGTMATSAKRFNDALKAFGKAIKIMPSSGQMKFYYGSTLIQLARYEEGIKILKESERNFEDIYLRKNLGVAYERLGQPEQAVAEYHRGREIGIGSEEASNLIPLIRYHQGQLPEAEQLFKETLRVRPTDWTAYSNLSAILLDSGRYDELLQALNPGPAFKYPEAYTLYGVALLKLGRSEEAEQNFRHTLSLSPRSVKARNNLAALHYMAGKKDDAIREWEEVLTMEPGNAIAKKNIESVKNSKGSAVEVKTD